MFKIFKIIKELKLYREYRNLIRKEELDSPRWSRAKLRRDRIYRIYTVINLPPQVTMSPDFPDDAKPSFVMSELKPINEYLKYLNLEELLTMSISPIEGTQNNSWLIIYQFLFRELNWRWVLIFLLQISSIIAGLIYLIF